MTSEYLFSQYDLRGVIEAQKKRISDGIETVAANRLLNTTAESWVEYFRSRFELHTPAIDEGGITVDQSEAKVDVSRDHNRMIFDRSRPFYLKGTEVTVFVPFTGEEDLFKCAPSTRTLNPPHGEVQGQELLLRYTRLDHDTAALKREIERDLGQIRQHLEWIAQDIAPFNSAIPQLVKEKVEARRQKLLKDQGLVGGLGFAVRRRADAPETYTVPTIRRKATPVRAPRGKAATTPEPALAMEEYEHILKVISNMVAVMERSPKAFKGMKEEDLRQHFLVQLNGQYEGQATGETFNFEGKTDILIRSEGRNIFIAECKFWDGPESITKAIDQLLGYSSWRDTKTALLVFNRQKNLSAVVQKVREAVNAHPNVVREIPFPSETGHRVILHHRSDKNRELVCTVLVFDVPT
jgi:hypothetical protein